MLGLCEQFGYTFNPAYIPSLMLGLSEQFGYAFIWSQCWKMEFLSGHQNVQGGFLILLDTQFESVHAAVVPTTRVRLRERCT